MDSKLSEVVDKSIFLLKDRYELLMEISWTPTSKIYKAFDHCSQKIVAIKMIHIKQNNEEENIRILKEVKIMNTINSSNIVQCMNAFKYTDKLFCIVMEYLDSITLKQKMNIFNGSWNLIEIITIFLKILVAVRVIHNKGIIHNDLKPENIIYFRNGKIKIIDFGISQFYSKDLVPPKLFPEPHLLIGTPQYIAPEIASYNNLDTRSDI